MQALGNYCFLYKSTHVTGNKYTFAQVVKETAACVCVCACVHACVHVCRRTLPARPDKRLFPRVQVHCCHCWWGRTVSHHCGLHWSVHLLLLLLLWHVQCWLRKPSSVPATGATSEQHSCDQLLHSQRSVLLREVDADANCRDMIETATYMYV